jgi:hypothetical protein
LAALAEFRIVKRHADLRQRRTISNACRKGDRYFCERMPRSATWCRFWVHGPMVAAGKMYDVAHM